MDSILSLLICTIVPVVILYLIIKAAIDNSQTAANIKDIKRVLYELSNKQIIEPEEEITLLDLDYNKCPACHAKISEKDEKCPSCGISLINE